MFALTPSDLSGNILDCASGPASFNAFVENARVAYDEFIWRDIESTELPAVSGSMLPRVIHLCSLDTIGEAPRRK